ncbi:hypothetical protein ACLBR5_12125 [Escherichia coli]
MTTDDGKFAVANSASVSVAYYHRLGCFGVFRQFVEVDIRLIAVIAY